MKRSMRIRSITSTSPCLTLVMRVEGGSVSAKTQGILAGHASGRHNSPSPALHRLARRPTDIPPEAPWKLSLLLRTCLVLRMTLIFGWHRNSVWMLTLVRQQVDKRLNIVVTNDSAYNTIIFITHL
eukprot:1144522-Pelagomonas_calceolata.AAC.2